MASARPRFPRTAWASGSLPRAMLHIPDRDARTAPSSPLDVNRLISGPPRTPARTAPSPPDAKHQGEAGPWVRGVTQQASRQPRAHRAFAVASRRNPARPERSSVSWSPRQLPSRGATAHRESRLLEGRAFGLRLLWRTGVHGARRHVPGDRSDPYGLDADNERVPVRMTD